jgi:hypothetical protein
VHVITDAINARRALDLEQRKIELEERGLYLSTLEHSQITEEKTHEISLWILRNLKDYPQGKKAKHADEDVKLLVETIATLRKPNSN